MFPDVPPDSAAEMQISVATFACFPGSSSSGRTPSSGLQHVFC